MMSWNRWLVGVLVGVLLGCADPEEGRGVVERWPNGNVKKEATVVAGDTVEIAVYDEAGRLSKVSRWSERERHGKWEAFYPDGSPWSVHHYANGVQVGAYQTWHPNGQPFISGQYDADGTPSGTWRFFDESGALVREEMGSAIHNKK
jgi:antitoxin component YwqK of YwqJK toxin-antitoxin module